MVTGNKGEWSEIYVLLKLLADGRIYAADSDLNRLDNIYYPILRIIREETGGEVIEYKTGEKISIYFNGKKIKELPSSEFKKESEDLLLKICDKKLKGAFGIEETEKFMSSIYCYKISAPSTNKRDITMNIFDINTGYSPTVGFSIKSELGSAPTLLNAGKTTNFIYKIIHNYPDIVRETNEIYIVTKKNISKDVRGRINNIINDKGCIEYYDMNNKTFKDNLVLIDSNMDKIIAETLMYYYRDGITNCDELVANLERENPMNFGNVNAYRYKFKKFLTAVALGMKPGTVWDGIDEATGGYIVVTRQGEVLAYHIYNRNYFEEYLLKNTKYDTPSTSRHEFGEVYSAEGEDFINLNFQVRFRK